MLMQEAAPFYGEAWVQRIRVSQDCTKLIVGWPWAVPKHWSES